MPAPGAPLERGYRLGKYEVIGRLSVGGMAELYLAVLVGQGGFKKFVALKRVLPAVAQQENFMKMFLDEARITAALSHANIAQVFELAEDPGNREPVLAMEYVAGQNVAQIIRRARDRNIELPVGFACRVMHDALLGLHSAHHFVDPLTGKPMPVIHRDINPRNIMVTYTGGTKVIDFGIAKARGRLDSTQVGMVKGTLRYMSPEQVTLKTLDGRSDLFAASVVLYELLSGLKLFDEPSDVAVLTRVAKCDVPPLHDVMPSLSTELIDVLSKGLAREPAARWQSGREYARALDQAVPELFDDAAVAELMSRLFEDRIALSRALLQSTSTEASYANLELMKEGQDEPGSKPEVKPEPIGEVPTSPSKPKLSDAPPPRPALDEAPVPTTISERPPAGAELPTVQERPRTSTAATIVVDEPATAATAKELRSVPEEPVTDPGPVKPAPKPLASSAETVAPGNLRRPTAGVPAQKAPQPRRLTSQGQQRLEPIPEAPPPGSLPRGSWLVFAVVVLVLLALGGLALYSAAGDPAPEELRPLPAPGSKPRR